MSSSPTAAAASGSSCVDPKTHCGAAGQPCNSGNCNSPLACMGGLCVTPIPTGDEGQPCNMVSAKKKCNTDNLTCVNNVCQVAGGIGQACTQDPAKPCNLEGLGCIDGKCWCVVPGKACDNDGNKVCIGNEQNEPFPYLLEGGNIQGYGKAINQTTSVSSLSECITYFKNSGGVQGMNVITFESGGQGNSCKAYSTLPQDRTTLCVEASRDVRTALSEAAFALTPQKQCPLKIK